MNLDALYSELTLKTSAKLALVVLDGKHVLVNQNDCRTTDLDALGRHGRVDLHFLQFSGAIWYPMVYDETPGRMRELVDSKVDSQLTRAMRYVEVVDARAVVPFAGPPAFLDEDLRDLAQAWDEVSWRICALRDNPIWIRLGAPDHA